MMPAEPAGALDSPDALLEFLRRLETQKSGQRAAYVALSRFGTAQGWPAQRQLARDGFRRLADGGEGSLFSLPNGDLLFFYAAAAGTRVKAEFNRLVGSLGEVAPAADGAGPDALGRIYDLSRELGDVVALVRCEICKACGHACDDAANEPRGGDPIKLRLKRRERQRLPVPAEALPKLNASLARTDVANFVRLRSVCRVLPDAPPEYLFTDLSLSLSALSEAIIPGCDFAADRAIARYLMKTLDQRILTMVLRRDLRVQRDQIAIPISLMALRSESFRHFDAGIPIVRQGSILLKISFTDAFADLDAARFLARLARHRGYRIVLSGVTPTALSFLRLDGFGVDYVSCERPSSLTPSDPLESLGEARRRVAPAQLILAGIDSREALLRGIDVGIELYQGSFPEKALGERQRAARRSHAR